MDYPITIKKVETHKDLRRFVNFVYELYSKSPCFCPPIHLDEMNTFSPKGNPSLEVCEFQAFLAYQRGIIVGRICAIINHKANEKWQQKRCRFGWFDFIDDYAVSRALLDAAADWGRSKGMIEFNGPLGFTDFDRQGLLLEGYEYHAPMASLYNYPYYVSHFEKYGLVKEMDWIEYRNFIKEEAPERMVRMARIVEKRSGIHVVKVRNARELKKRYGFKYFDILDEAYQQLYNYQPMTEHQKQYYCNMYFPLVNYDFVTLLADDNDRLVGIGVGMPDLTAALQKTNGRLFPFGWITLLKALRAKKMTDFNLLLIGVSRDYVNKGLTALIFADQVPIMYRYGIRRVETTSILETNIKSLACFEDFDKIQHKRRRAYVMPL